MFGFYEPRRASQTAEFMALFRALETCRAPSQRLFEDRYAATFLRPALRLAVRGAALPVVGPLVPWCIDRRWPGARSSGVARTRLIDDLLAAATEEGFRQFVLLGVGFDARAYRLPALANAVVFEVDHPATLEARQQRLGASAPHVRTVAVDFERDDLKRALCSAGFTIESRSFFVWEGVTNYLHAEAVDATLLAVRMLSAAGDRLVFTYVHRGLIEDSVEFPGTRRLSRTLNRVGEVWRFGLEPAEVASYLAARGFRLLSDCGAADYRARYAAPGAPPQRGYEFYRAALTEAAESHREEETCRK